MSDARRSQTRALVVFVTVVVAIGATFGGCTSYERQNGEACLKNADCLSEYCLAQSCAPPPSLLSGEAGASEDNQVGGTSDASASDSMPTSTPDSSGDSSTDGPPVQQDAGHDSGQSGAPEDGASANDANDEADDASDANSEAANDASDADDANNDAAPVLADANTGEEDNPSLMDAADAQSSSDAEIGDAGFDDADVFYLRVTNSSGLPA